MRIHGHANLVAPRHVFHRNSTRAFYHRIGTGAQEETHHLGLPDDSSTSKGWDVQVSKDPHHHRGIRETNPEPREETEHVHHALGLRLLIHICALFNEELGDVQPLWVPKVTENGQLVHDRRPKPVPQFVQICLLFQEDCENLTALVGHRCSLQRCDSERRSADTIHIGPGLHHDLNGACAGTPTESAGGGPSVLVGIRPKL
mmetsp:Transcript_49765/g.118555  ORF Transcript_49765/g.118555 Transcript_49765/m.118555 type:complete len:202 (-) Transcript_49765:37-642(-)